MLTVTAPQIETPSWLGWCVRCVALSGAVSHAVVELTGFGGSCTVTGLPTATSDSDLVICSCST